MDESRQSNIEINKDRNNREQSPPSKNQEEKKEDNNFILQYSPRTEYSVKLEEEEEMYSELKQNFDPITIKIIKKHFKERLGALKKEEMVAILKNHLLGFLPDHPDREKIMVRLLSRLFGDIDLNDNGDLEWNEFTNYIIHLGGSGGGSKSNVAYRLKFYSKSEINILPSDLTEQIVYSFYIEKYNALGVVEENKSVIKFFDGKTCAKLKISIDLKDIQKSVDLVEFNKLKEKAKKIILQEEEKKIKQITMNKEGFDANTGINNLKNNKRKKKKEIENFEIGNEEEEEKIIYESYKNNKNKKNKKSTKKKERPIVYRKLSVLCSCFIPDYDLLMISSTNNTITAWKFTRNEIKNVNVTSEYRFSKDELKIAIFITSSPQTSMVWDSQQKCLLTGQSDGKILKWDLTNPNPILEDTLNIATVMEKVNKSHLSKKDNQEIMESKRLMQLLREKSVRHKDLISSPYVFEDKSKNMAVSYLLILKKLQLLAASYYNGYVILWDTILKEYRKCYFDQSTAIYSIAYDSIRNLLFASGFNHDIYVYDPYIDGSSIYKLTGHSCSINIIETNEKESELISLDILGNIKIWDTTELINFQTVKINEEVEDKDDKKQHSENNTKKKKLSSNLKMVYLRKLKKYLYMEVKAYFLKQIFLITQIWPMTKSYVVAITTKLQKIY